MALLLMVLVGCATTEFKPFEGKVNSFVGEGGTKTVVDGMEIWDNGDPPRTFKVLGVIDDYRPGGIIPMSQLFGDVVKKAREAGGSALIQVSNQSQIAGFYTSGSTSSNAATVRGSAITMPVRRNSARFVVISYIE
ncbi:MAG: hypothetical protein KIT73_11020 [Burkholderiales bacterium]|nr:hypothetical protein [Burkholderiales bacterium]